MTEHIWVLKEADAGALGMYDHWVCLGGCGACGGMPDQPKPLWSQGPHLSFDARKRPFLSGHGRNVVLSLDCDEAKNQIANYHDKEKQREATQELVRLTRRAIKLRKKFQKLLRFCSQR